MSTASGNARQCKLAPASAPVGVRPPRLHYALGALVVALLATPASGAQLGSWLESGCDPPANVYSTGGGAGGRPMCCANRARPSVGVCPGGAVCPPSGVCGGGDTCVPLTDPLAQLPNVVVYYSDDQAYCDYGFMGTCRTDRDGTPVPAPYSPALDDLAKHGKVFTVAHNVAPWCLPSRDAVLTGRLPSQRGCSSASCRPPGARPDPDLVGSASTPTLSQLVEQVGPGYCTYQAGKGLSKVGFDAVKVSKRTGKTPCSRCGSTTFSQIDPTHCQFDPAACPDPSDASNPACDTAPKCGEDDPTIPSGTEISSTGEVDQFLTDLVATGTDGKQYLPKKFMLWFAPALPHTPVAPPDVVEHRPHATDVSSPDICRDFLFGYLCDEPTPGNVHILGPRFPFGAPAYAAQLGFVPRSKMQGLYGNVWWLDNSMQRIRKELASHVVETADGPEPLSASTVILFMSDNGMFLPRSKKKFTENGYRSPLIVYDPRHETAPGDPYKVENDIAHSTDIMPTVLSYIGAPNLKPAEALGKDLRGWLENPNPTPVRNGLCGTDIRSLNGTHARYILPRTGSVGACTTPTGTPCATDGDCAAGQLCGTDQQCYAPTSRNCIDDDDCKANGSDPSVCRFQDRKWCSGSPSKTCNTDAECRTSCSVCSKVPSRTCTSNGDCGTSGPCVAAPAGALACSCAARSVKLYHDEQGIRHLMTNLLTDPDESTLVDGTAGTFAAGTNAKLTQRLRCCMDAWWLPPGIIGASCPAGCDSRVSCN